MFSFLTIKFLTLKNIYKSKYLYKIHINIRLLAVVKANVTIFSPITVKMKPLRGVTENG